MKIYQDNGYIDVGAIVDTMRQNNVTFTFLWGGRGIGKTYNSLAYFTEQKIKFLLMRRQTNQMEALSTKVLSPFNVLNTDKGWNIQPKMVTAKKLSTFAEEREEDGKIIRSEPVCSFVSLQGIAGLRGFDASTTDFLLFDEFIREGHERPIPNEADAFLNAYETINRNRELQGKPPLLVLCMANSNNIVNPLFVKLGLVSKALQLEKDENREYSIDRERGYMLIDGKKSPISKMKANTALYKLVGQESSFYGMAIGNEFTDVDLSNVRSRPLVEYKPITVVGELCIYKHKFKRMFYVSMHTQGTPDVYTTNKIDLKRFARKYAHLWLAYLASRVEFEAYECKALFENYFDAKT